MASTPLVMLAVTLTGVISLQDEDIFCTQRYARLCQGKGTHVACRYPVPGPGEDCVDYAKVEMDNVMKAFITNYINKRRQRVASGRERVRGGVRIPKPKLMMFVQWDKELALLAQRLADQCRFVHDECRATVHYPHAGQSVGEVRLRKLSDLNSLETMTMKAIRRVLDAWWSEKRRVDVRHLFLPFRVYYRGGVWGHFSQLVVWSLRGVGCGAVRQRRRLLLVCDFSHTNMLGERTLDPGSQAACPGITRRHAGTAYAHLCRNPDTGLRAHDEVEDYNDVDDDVTTSTSTHSLMTRTHTRQLDDVVSKDVATRNVPGTDIEPAEMYESRPLIQSYLDLQTNGQDAQQSYQRNMNVARKFEVNENGDNYIEQDLSEDEFATKQLILNYRTTVDTAARSDGLNKLEVFGQTPNIIHYEPILRFRPRVEINTEVVSERQSTFHHEYTEERPVRQKWHQASYRPKRPGASAFFTKPRGRFYSRTALVSLMVDKDDHDQFFKDTGFSIINR